MAVANLDISSFRGISIGAVHWYAKLIIEDEREKYGHKNIELQRPLTLAEAKTLNVEKKAMGYMCFNHKAGDMTEGFNTETEAIQCGVDKFNSLYKGVLYLGDYGCCSAWKDVLIYLPEHKTIAIKMNKIAKEFQSLNGYEGKNRKQVEKLDDAWRKLYLKLNKLCEKI